MIAVERGDVKRVQRDMKEIKHEDDRSLKSRRIEGE